MQANLEIKKYLEENGITQIFISRKTGIEASKLSLALNGDRKLTLDEFGAYLRRARSEYRQILETKTT